MFSDMTCPSFTLLSFTINSHAIKDLRITTQPSSGCFNLIFIYPIMAKLLALSLSLCFLLFSGCFAIREHQPHQKQHPQQNECQLEQLNALEPDNRIESEGGIIETWNPNNRQFRCAGVALSRCTLQRNSLRRPFYSNAPQEIFIQQGQLL